MLRHLIKLKFLYIVHYMFHDQKPGKICGISQGSHYRFELVTGGCNIQDKAHVLECQFKTEF